MADICNMEREKMNIVIVGHVDHGKSTLVGRLLTDTQSLPEGKLEQVKLYCKNNSRPFEYAFLIDALKDEQSQGITIDSARCFFKSKKRDYIIIDAPGHIEFLKNMISGAARAEAALLVIDANEGIQENSKRHGYMLSMLGIKQVIVVVNKMDLVKYNEDVYNDIKRKYTEFLTQINIQPMEFIPISAINGDNLVENTDKLRWFHGNCILDGLDSFKKENFLVDKPFRMHVQDIYKFTAQGDSRRIVAGRVESGKITVGDNVIFLPSLKKSKIKSIESFNIPQKKSIGAGYSTGFTLTEQIYLSRGEVMCKEHETLPHCSSIITVNLFWLGTESVRIGKWYKLKIGSFENSVMVKKITSVLDASTLAYEHKNSVSKNEVAHCVLQCKVPFAFDLFSNIQATGRFVIVNEYNIVGGGIILDFTHAENNIVWHEREITRNNRANLLGHKSALLWFTGLSGSGKSTIAVALQKRLIKEGKLAYILDGDNIRHGLNSDLGFSEKDRIENIRRIGEVAALFVDSGVMTITSFISPYNVDRDLVRTKLGNDFIEIYIKCSLDECEKRDTKGLYRKARLGEITNFTGISAPYEVPEKPELVLETETLEVHECVEKIMKFLHETDRI